jgi:hypothetical protein
MRLLPRPGFEIEDLVVEENPAFGAEPILRCAHVTAYVRLLSLWRGRLEIARIAFEEPSLNLVRNVQGRWNFDSVLKQAAQLPNAPTAQRHAGEVPRFPYIDASDARVNFKFGNEKMPVSFLNADLAVWLANPGEWRVQFAAQPARTDLTLDLANTGLLRLEGTLRRSPSGGQTISQMPAVFHAEWSNAPLGQLTRIFAGSDADWRGELELSADLTGTADRADLKLTAKGRGIHRAEFEPREPLNLDAACRARLLREQSLLDGITCLLPSGEGHLLLTGSVREVAGTLDPELSLEINHLPVAQAFDGLRLVRSGFAPEVQAAGVIDGNFAYASSAPSAAAALQGQAVVEGLTLTAPEFEKPWSLPALHFMIAANSEMSSRHRSALPIPKSTPGVPDGPTLVLEPFALTSGAAPLQASGGFTRSGFSIRIGGQSRVGQIAALGKEFGLLRNRTVSLAPQGTAEVDLTLHGPWLSSVTDAATPLAVEGSIRLHNAALTGDFLAQPLQITLAQAMIGGNRIDWNASALTYGPLRGEGTLSYPVFCSAAECFRHFNVRLPALDAATAQSALLGATHHGELVQQLLDRLGGSSRSWPALTGTVEVGVLTVKQVSVRELSAALNIEGDAVGVESLTGRAYSGNAPIGALHLSGGMKMTDGSPHYELQGQLEHAAVPALASIFQQKWGPGFINMTVSLKLAGYQATELESSAAGSFHWEWVKGGLPADVPVGEAKLATVSAESPVAYTPNPLARFDSWMADGTIADGTFQLVKSQMTTGAESFPVTGTVDFNREVSLVFEVKPSPIHVNGSLEKTVVSAAPISP